MCEREGERLGENTEKKNSEVERLREIEILLKSILCCIIHFVIYYFIIWGQIC